MKLPVALLLASTMTLIASDAAPKAEQEIMSSMEAWKQAMLKRDAVVLGKLFHPDLTYSHSSGKTESKSEAIEAATKGTNIMEAIEMSDMKVRLYGKTALVKGMIEIKSNNNGTRQDLHLSVLHVWMKTPEGWQLVARQSTRMNP